MYINFNVTDSNYDRLKILCESFDLRNIIKQKTCFTGEQGTLIDLILTNRPRSFQNTVATETGLSDHHLMISTFLKAHLVRLKPKNVFYRNYKNFDPSQFLDDMKNAQFTCYTEDHNLNYENLVNTFKSIIDQHAPLKQKTLNSDWEMGILDAGGGHIVPPHDNF